MKKMKAFLKVKPEPGAVEYLDFDVPEVREEEVLIQVMAAGICGTDVHLYDWVEDKIRDSKPILPVVMGHEFAGIIAEVGSHVKDLKVGDRVTISPILYCGKCHFCKNGQQNTCDNRATLGSRAHGGFAEFVSVPSTNVFKIEDEVPFDLGALSELTCVGLHAIERVRLTHGDSVAIVGAGPVGLMMAILSKHSGASSVFITGLEVDFERLELARQIGAIPIRADCVDPRNKILEYTDRLGADVVFETAGSPAGVIQSLSIVRKAGRIGILGQGPGSTEILTATLSFREIELIGTRAHTPKHWQKVARTVLNAADDLKRMITHRFPLSMAEEGIRKMKKREGMKVILLPQER